MKQPEAPVGARQHQRDQAVDHHPSQHNSTTGLPCCEDFLYQFKAGPAGGLRPPSSPATTRSSPGHRPHPQPLWFKFTEWYDRRRPADEGGLGRIDETNLAIAALVVSLLSIAISAFASRRTDLRARMPVPVFVYHTQTGWILRNVGNGPALYVIVAQKAGGDWLGPKRVPHSVAVTS